MAKNNRNDEEQFIFNQMIEGDKNAFRFFFDKYYTDLCNLVNIYIHNKEIAEEIVQDIYVYFWEKREKIKIESSVKAYLLSASKNKSLNFLRNEKTKLLIHEKFRNTSDSFYEMPSNAMDSLQLREIIDNAINRLPEKCKKIYQFAREQELSYKEIAEELGISAKTVENQMSIALKKLRKQLRPYYNDIFLVFLYWLVQ